MVEPSKVAYFGGTFNPIHNGHLGVIRAVAKSNLVDTILVSPCEKHPHGKLMTSPVHRGIMVEKALNELKNEKFPCKIVYDLRELVGHVEFGSTWELIKQWGYIRPIISLDNANTLSTWKNYEKLIKESRMIILPRKGVEVFKYAWYHDKRHDFVSNTEIQGISSSEIRSMIRLARKSEPEEILQLKEYLPHSVFDYIIEQNLYK